MTVQKSSGFFRAPAAADVAASSVPAVGLSGVRDFSERSATEPTVALDRATTVAEIREITEGPTSERHYVRYPAMQSRARRIVRIALTVVGLSAAILAFGTLVPLSSFVIAANNGWRTEAHEWARFWEMVKGGCIYLAIAIVCFIEVWRLKPLKTKTRGFDVVVKASRDVAG